MRDTSILLSCFLSSLSIIVCQSINCNQCTKREINPKRGRERPILKNPQKPKKKTPKTIQLSKGADSAFHLLFSYDLQVSVNSRKEAGFEAGEIFSEFGGRTFSSQNLQPLGLEATLPPVYRIYRLSPQRLHVGSFSRFDTKFVYSVLMKVKNKYSTYLFNIFYHRKSKRMIQSYEKGSHPPNLTQPRKNHCMNIALTPFKT